MDTQKYNGWTNRATWLCNLWFDHFDFSDHIEDLSESHTDKDDLLNTLEEWIENEVTEYVESTINEDNGFITDLVNQSLYSIDYRDLAEHYVDEVWDYILDHRKEELSLA